MSVASFVLVVRKWLLGSEDCSFESDFNHSLYLSPLLVSLSNCNCPHIASRVVTNFMLYKLQKHRLSVAQCNVIFWDVRNEMHDLNEMKCLDRTIFTFAPSDPHSPTHCMKTLEAPCLIEKTLQVMKCLLCLKDELNCTCAWLEIAPSACSSKNDHKHCSTVFTRH